MDQAIGTVRDTAALVRRVVLRTLTVVGGAAAGTAIAWCISTAAASADTTDVPLPAPEDPVVRTIVSPVSDALDGAFDGTVGSVADRLPSAQPPRAIRELGEEVKRAAGEFGERAQEQLPECVDPLCGLEQIGSEAPVAGDGAGPGRSDSPSPAPVAVSPAGAGKVATAGVDPDDTAQRTATGRAYSDGMSRRGSPAPGMPSFPGWPAPLAPAAPASGHTGSTGNQAESSTFASLPWQDRTPTLVRGLTTPATESTTVGRVGAQPGVTPD